MRWFFPLMIMVTSLYGWYGDVGLQVTPVYAILNDSENTTYGYGVYRVEGKGSLFLSQWHFAEVRIGNTLLVGTNMSNMWEVRKLAWQSESEYREDVFSWAISVGREQFQLDEGKILHSLGDGFVIRLSYKGMRGEGALLYRGLTEMVDTNRLYASRTNERLDGGVSLSFPLWFFSSVKAGVVGSIDLRTNTRTTVVVFSGGLEGSVGSWVNYALQGWYETGEVSLTNASQSDALSAWAGETTILVGKKGFPWQGQVRFLLASGEGDSAGWNRFVSIGTIEGPVVFLHPIANLVMLQTRLTWRPWKEVFSLSLVYDLLWRTETKDIVLVSLYGDGHFLGQEVALQMVSRFDPSMAVFVNTGVLWKGDAFALNREKPLYRVSLGMNISL